MTSKQFVLHILPSADVSLMANGWMISAKLGHSPCLVSGCKTEEKAWYKAARMLGMHQR